MKQKHVTLFVLGFLAASIAHAEFEITSLSKNGEIEWQNSTSNGVHVVEWASSLSGKWNQSWPQINLSATGGTTRVEVPMFYRVVWTTNNVSSSVPVLSYNAPSSGKVMVYQGTYDSNDIRMEITDDPFVEIIDGQHRLVWPTRNYNRNSGNNVMNLIYTSYRYADETSWRDWIEIDRDGSTNEMNYVQFKLNMSVNEMTASGSRLIESGKKIFPELGQDELEYAKLKFNFGSSFFIVYKVRGYGEYVLSYGETEDSKIQKYLIYSEDGDQTVGTKPSWYDSAEYWPY